MSPLDRIDAICAEQQEFPCAHACCGNDLASALVPLLPQLREWAAAEMERHGGRDRAGEGESIARRCYDADRALLAALRGSP